MVNARSRCARPTPAASLLIRVEIGPNAGNMHMPSRLLAPVSMVGVSPFAMMTHPSLPVKTVKDMIALAKARPGQINFGSSGQGSTGHLAWELFKLNAKVNLTHVPYRGSAPALVGVIAGEIDTVIFGVSAAYGFIKQRQVRVIAVTCKLTQTLPAMPRE